MREKREREKKGQEERQEGGGVISTQMPFIQQHVVYTDTNPYWHGVSLGLGEGQDHMMAYNHCALSLTTTMMSPLNYTPLTSWNEERVHHYHDVTTQIHTINQWE